MKFFMPSYLGRGVADGFTNALDLLDKLDERQIISETNLEKLLEIFNGMKNIRLYNMVERYIETTKCRSQSLPIDRNFDCTNQSLSHQNLASVGSANELSTLPSELCETRLKQVSYSNCEAVVVSLSKPQETCSGSKTSSEKTEVKELHGVPTLLSKDQNIGSDLALTSEETEVKVLDTDCDEVHTPLLENRDTLSKTVPFSGRTEMKVVETDCGEVPLTMLSEDTFSISTHLPSTEGDDSSSQTASEPPFSDENVVSELLNVSLSTQHHVPTVASSDAQLSPIVLRSYQLELAHKGLAGENIIICAPTGSGKTYTAAYICQQRRKQILKERNRFKAVFIVCTRNLVPQQCKALKEIITDENAVASIEGTKTLQDYLKGHDVVVATAQLLVNAMHVGEVKITELDLLMVDECHHADLKHPYNAVMALYHQVRAEDASAKLPQIVGLTASLGVGSGNPTDHYVQICANLDCKRITHVRDGTPFMYDLLRYSPRPTKDQISVVDPCDPAEPFVKIISKMMEDIEKNDLKLDANFSHGSLAYESWIVQFKIAEYEHGAIQKGASANALYNLNSVLMTRGELRSKDAFAELEKFFKDSDSTVSDRIKRLYENVRGQLEEIVSSEPVHGKSAKLEKLCTLLRDLHSRQSDPRGILLARTRLAVTRLVEIIKEVPDLEGKVFPRKLVGQSTSVDDGAMTSAQQEKTLQCFRLDSSNPKYCNLLVATTIAQEGLDMPKCNFVIRYNFVSNEIGTVQARGRARAPNSECYLIVDRDSAIERRERNNLENEFRMMQALDDVDEIPEYQLTKWVKEKQKQMLEQRRIELERKAADEAAKSDNLSVTIHCFFCTNLLCRASDLRVKGNNYICIDENFAQQVILDEDVKEFRYDTKLGSILCWKCRNGIGLKMEYNEGRIRYGYTLGAKNVTYRIDSESKYLRIKQWTKTKFKIEKIGNNNYS